MCIPLTLRGRVPVADRIKCGTCTALGAVVKGVVKLTGSSALMRSKARRLCSVVPVARSVCEGYIDTWAVGCTDWRLASR